MKFEITYLKPKKKGYAKQSATFLKIEDCFFWESIIKEQGCKDIVITPH